MAERARGGQPGRSHGGRTWRRRRPRRSRPVRRRREARSLEGFLFPATYDLYVTDPARTLVAKQLEAFTPTGQGRPALRAVEEPDPVRRADHRLDDRARGGRPEGAALVAAVIYNRLHAGMPLGIDATLRYGLGIPPTEAITKQELALELAVQHAQVPRAAADADRQPGPGVDRGGGAPGEGRLPLLRPEAGLPKPLLHRERRRVRLVHAEGSDRLLIRRRTRLVGLIGTPVAALAVAGDAERGVRRRGLDWAYLPLPVGDGQPRGRRARARRARLRRGERDRAAQARGGRALCGAKLSIGEHARRQGRRASRRSRPTPRSSRRSRERGR